LIDFATAKALATTAASAAMRRPIVILDDRTIEREFGWVFFYQSEEFVLHERDGARLFGNAPIIVSRQTGRASLTDTSFPIQDLIDAFETLRAERFEAGDWRAYLKGKAPPL
jgi:hypothetical protein